MIHLDNDAVTDLLTMPAVVDALRIGFDQLATGEAAHVPRLELWSPSVRDDAYHCLGSMSGTTAHFGVTAIRIKSDVIHWPAGRRQEKFAAEPGTFCGFVLLFSTATGAPLALVNDGILQQMRVGASAGIAAETLANPGPSRLGMIGSGAMARSHLEAIAHTCRLDEVTVFSPTRVNRERFAQEMSSQLGIVVRTTTSAEDAVTGADIVVTATNSMGPTFDPAAVDDGALVMAVTRREIGTALMERADRVLQLGEYTIGSDAGVPGLEFPQSGAGGFVAGTPSQRTRLPWRHRAESGRHPSLIDVLAGREPGRRNAAETLLFINLGVQGIQFAASAGYLYHLAVERGVGTPFGGDAFLQDVRD